VKSISLKVTVWSVAALVLSLAAFIFIGDSVIGRSAAQNFTQFNHVLFRQAIAAYQAGGANGLSSYLHELNRPGAVQFYMCDSRGRDLERGADLSALVQETVGSHRPYFKNRNAITMGLSSEDGRYIWLVSSPAPSFVLFAPFYVLLLVTVAVLFWLITANIARPLRHLAQVVDRFGQGELKARSSAKSKDEIGNLSRSFNAMAERIQTLLTTERQLLQDVSHELRSPLARLTFEAELVRKTADRDVAASRLRHEIDRLSELVGTLIDMARAEGEPGTIEMEYLSLNDLVLTTAEDCEIEARDRHCKFIVIAPEVFCLEGNAELLRRAFENVLRNAIRYAPVDTTVEVKLVREGDLAVISVRDWGSGIPVEVAERIFDPFFRTDASRNENKGGLGLGLAIARRAVRVHRGDITAANVSPGALLRIVLPLDSNAGK
jgi:two-component system sensor histidine kinase CpxA